jgi:hypothetical protein
MTTVPDLYCGVMDSSSVRAHAELFDEVRTVSGVNRFDLILIRDLDRKRWGLSPTVTTAHRAGSAHPHRMSEIMADEDSFKRIQDRLIELVSNKDVIIPAFASYFPDVTSENAHRRQHAIQAIANSADLALTLHHQFESKVPHPILEIVCGSLLDRRSGPQAGSGCDEIDVGGREYKLTKLCDSLQQVVDRVQALQPARGWAHCRFTIALEMEPGPTYVLNSADAMHSVAQRLDGTHPRDQKTFAASLGPHVGFNLDIAHMRIAEIVPQCAAHANAKQRLSAGVEQRIVHSHISDHPGMHTHDQYVGSWTNIHAEKAGYQPHLQLLLQRAADKTPIVPFSRCVAVELEGCNRIFTIHDSLSRLKHAIAVAQQRFRP